MHPRLHEAEDVLIRVASLHRDPSLLHDWQKRALNQAARELMLAQSSDWTFMIDAQTVTEYAANRITRHLEHVHDLIRRFEQASSALLPEPAKQASIHSLADLVTRLEKAAPIFPEADYTNYSSSPNSKWRPELWSTHNPLSDEPAGLRILMLAWEFPPRVIGGLARAVCDLSRQLAASGHRVHVITCQAEDAPAYAVDELVHVHRVPILQSIQAVPFLDWVFQMNLAFAECVQNLVQGGFDFDIIHAHDWLVYYAARESKEVLSKPLVATIHATEYGRSQGQLESNTQLRIHELERKLTQTADLVIVCSQYMKEEVQYVFELPESKVVPISNGVRANPLFKQQHKPTKAQLQEALSHTSEPDRILCFLGRLVYEKGVHVLIDAMKLLLKRYPQVKLIIAGDGPVLDTLRSQSVRWGDRICFTGFLDEQDKACLLSKAELCIFPSLYEPFGLVALEAMSSGTPLVVSSVGGLAEIVEHGFDGFTVPPEMSMP
ncbi:DUF1957 domain-containing protein [Paenibacillus hexagrammi]|uniref:DUF1957 domain-containing protein n=1 Tax=Paenibacillus hexagrammi TaxID=2908839 RepID=A0ABY3SQJ3_9BACL|nr:DUF1957 domain-containing protein [Paenibacillus sp. YPD9-1]